MRRFTPRALPFFLLLLLPQITLAQGGGFGLGPAGGSGGGGGYSSGDLIDAGAGTSSDPGYGFSVEAGMGVYRLSSGILGISTGNNGRVGVYSGGLLLGVNSMGFGASLTGPDTYVARGGASGWVALGTTAGAVDGVFNLGGVRLGASGANGFFDYDGETRILMTDGGVLRWSSVQSATGTSDLYLRRSAASTLIVDADGSGGEATLTAGTILASGTYLGQGGNYGNLRVSSAGMEMRSDMDLLWSSNTDAKSTKDLRLRRSAASVASLDDGSGGAADFVVDQVAAAGGFFPASSVVNRPAWTGFGLTLNPADVINWSATDNVGGGSGDVWIRRSAASTLTVDSDGAGGAATLAVSDSGKFGFASDTDTWIDRPAANQIRLVAANAESATFSATGMSLPASRYVTMTEMTSPSAAAANTARVFVKDNGAGKTQLVVIFSSGAEQVIATQP